MSNSFRLNYNVSCGSIFAGGSTIGVLNAINISSSTLNVSSGATFGNINITGTLSQNGGNFSSSQWSNGSSGSIFYTGGNVGINTTSPNYTLDVKGDVRVSGTIKSGSGTIGPSFLLQYRYTDVTSGSYNGYTSSNTILFCEDGNPGTNFAIGNSSGFGNVSDASNDGISWNYARFVMRGVTLNTGTTGNSVVLQPFLVNGSGTLYTQGSFTVTDSGSNYGYTTWISPWMSTTSYNGMQALGIKALSINDVTGGNVRIGQTSLQFH